MNVKDKIPGYNELVLPYHYLQSLAAGIKAGFPGRKMRIIGVTGTNGKTTTCFMIWKMLNSAGHKTGLMTTVAWGVPGMKGDTAEVDDDGLVKQIEHMTTVDPQTLNRRMQAIAKEGAEFLVLEVTSHALAQFRTLGLKFEIAVMTNVTHEHLDYHKTFENYRAAKCKLFRQAEYGIVNADDASVKYFVAALNGEKSTSGIKISGSGKGIEGENYTSYGIKNGRNRAKAVKLSASGIEYTVDDIIAAEEGEKKAAPLTIKVKIPGEFNVYNSLAAACVGKKLGLSNKQIEKGLSALKEVEGRMNRIELGQPYEVIVDFAHTPDAFLKVFSSVAEPKNGGEKKAGDVRGESAKARGKVIALFGGAGRRDESTRMERAKIAAQYSDICILTEDDSRDEDPIKIIDEFAKGCKEAGMNSEQIIIVPERDKAIKKAITLAEPGDIVLILGKGHEKTILRADGPHPFEDLKVTAAAIKEINK